MLNSVAVAVALFALLDTVQAQFASSPSRYYLPPVASEESITPPPPLITKQFFSVSAAEDAQDAQPRSKHLLIGRATRNYRVIFIRAPSAQSDAIKYTAELAPQEERTVIYVLSRKPQELQAEDIQPAKQQSQQAAKPEIFFIRYKTNEEAAAAQREIQTQYDELGGNTEHAAPFVAPVQSVVGALDATPAGQALMPPPLPANEGYDYQRPLARPF